MIREVAQAMLSSCKAVVLGRNAEQINFLTHFAVLCGFSLIERTDSDPIPATRTLIQFFLVHHQIGDEVLQSILKAVRHGGIDIHFSPVIVIADDCPFETVLRYVEMGVDDVISLPDKREILIQRLASQLNREHLYIETPGYFGPDRRRMQYDLGDPRRRGTAGHARFYIRRLPDVGTQIVRHQIFTESIQPPRLS